ncbi:hypothetical protein Bhyg_01689 [Pseudolycoriella hygida]|uniref:DUF2452 domain-containing protein n=1 Tax=Pseudolycoriella hygida TaxID=35572 RepID=A0A9Q0S735_9DIPT|nr:hypothetical protein Bhyg_01689 [Pseudolycoriella hygida]
MKRRLSTDMDVDNEYQGALKKVALVERNTQPNGYQLLNAYNVGRHEAADIISLAHQIETADVSIRNSASGKLTMILDQIKFLQAQAQKILEESEGSMNLHKAACNFRKVPGNIYHLFERESGQNYFSMLSPEEWGPSFTHKHLGSFRLEVDQSWTPIDKIKEVSLKNAWAHRLLDSTTINSSSFLAIDQVNEMK